MEEDSAIAEQFVELVSVNPACRSAYRAILLAADAPISRADAAAAVEASAHPATFIQAPQDAVTTLVRAQVLAQTILVNGEPYEGTPEDLVEDEAVQETDEISYLVQTTDAGRAALALLAPETRLRALLAEKPQHAPAFLKVLDAASGPEGATKQALEQLLSADPDALKYDARTRMPTVYPAYFTGALEDAGALQWNGRTARWQATEAGRAVLA